MGTRRYRRPPGANGLLGLWLIGVLGWALPGLALEPNRRTSQYNHDSWRSENGLPQNTVLTVAQTPDGYLWFGTFEGLARFDGARFAVFDRRNSPELAEQEIHALVVDATGVLWVGTNLGLFRFEGGQLHRPPEAGALAEAGIRGLAVDGKSVWISSSIGLVRAPVSGKGPWRFYTVQQGLPPGGTGAVTGDGEGGAWVGANQGLVHVSGETISVTPWPWKSDPKPLRALEQTRDGMLWVGSTNGLFSFRDGRFTQYGPEQGVPDAPVSGLLEDRDGNLWVASDRGLLRHNVVGFTPFTGAKVLAGDSLRGLMEDRDGRLWIGTWNDGVHYLSNGPFVTIGEPEGSHLDGVRFVLETRDGTLWMGSGRGLEQVKDGAVIQVGSTMGLPDESIACMAEGSDGALWVGTPTGAWRLTGERFVRALGPEQGVPADMSIFAMAPEPGGMWFATSEGLVELRDGRAVLHGQREGFTPEIILPMIREDSGTIWYGTYTGLVRFARGTFTRFTSKDGLAGDTVNILHVDPNGTLWVGTTAGVSRFKEGHFRSITTAQGLPDDTVFTLLPDEDGFFWSSSNKGIARISHQELEEVADGRRERVNGELFDDGDGMRVGECNGGSQPSGWKTRDGRMWFANLRGAVMMNPRDPRLRYTSPQPRIEEVRVQGKPVEVAERLELEPGQRDLDIRFTAIMVEGGSRVQFRYRLEGHDSHWVEAEGRRVATYTRLPPGTYRFQVEAMDRQGRWVEPGEVLEVTLKPFFYQAAWFYALCALGAGGLAAAIYGWRVGRLKRRERWLEARVEERTQELARANSELDANLRTLRATQSQLVQAGKMAAVGTLAAGVGHEINNPLAYIVSNLEHACEESETLSRMAEGSEPLRERLREMQQVLREALQGADRVRRIVRDLKTFSRQDEDARGPVDLRAVMDSAAKMAAGELRPRAQLIREYAADVPQVEGNEARLAQVFLNLIINAAQALPEGQPEKNEVRLVLKRGAEGQVVAEVRDTGCGIPPEVLGHIFDPFFTTKPVGVGTGLGLALCHAFITSMSGRIEVESQVGQGTVFRVTLPASSVPAPRAPVVSEARPPGEPARGRVLVVDDDPLVSAALRRTLARDHQVEMLVSSQRALELLSSPEGDFDVILCDLMMPEVTGMELHAHLEAVRPDRARRMVFITGGAYTPGARSFLERVRNPRVEKPFEPERLRSQVREWVNASITSSRG
ncbi:two-component regulator propeller domain-containing protein [Hyalangium versicolor]|uniref:two-component regulator propeller domain-containing protein n=1 Tax=Hyalangium versicolor TaxID=2861190 RepID=UPI001CCF4A66|nr:two-component regulator propeller domain-containing protein [Hyalangium versicolor]